MIHVDHNSIGVEIDIGFQFGGFFLHSINNLSTCYPHYPHSYPQPIILLFAHFLMPVFQPFIPSYLPTFIPFHNIQHMPKISIINPSFIHTNFLSIPLFISTAPMYNQFLYTSSNSPKFPNSCKIPPSFSPNIPILQFPKHNLQFNSNLEISLQNPL